MPKHLWTPEEAKAFSPIGIAANRAKSSERLINSSRSPQASPETFPDIPRQKALARVLKQLQAIDEHLDNAQDPKAWDMLTRAKERLAKVWFHLGGIAGPGQMKPQSPRAPRRAYSSAPLPTEWESAAQAPGTAHVLPAPQATPSTAQAQPNTTPPNTVPTAPEPAGQ